MPTRSKADLNIVTSTHEEVLAALMKASEHSAPMVQRFASHRDRIDLAVRELESERFEILSRRDHIRRQIEAVENGFAMHLEDIEATLKMYEVGINSLGIPEATPAADEPMKATAALGTPQPHIASDQEIPSVSLDNAWFDRLAEGDASPSEKE